MLGPLATFAEPHSYDLCPTHAETLSAPLGWEVVRLAPDPAAGQPSGDDLLALADAVREAAVPVTAAPTDVTGRAVEVGRRGHLRVLRSHPDPPDRARPGPGGRLPTARTSRTETSKIRGYVADHDLVVQCERRAPSRRAAAARRRTGRAGRDSR